MLLVVCVQLASELVSLLLQAAEIIPFCSLALESSAICGRAQRYAAAAGFSQILIELDQKELCVIYV